MKISIVPVDDENIEITDKSQTALVQTSSSPQ